MIYVQAALALAMVLMFEVSFWSCVDVCGCRVCACVRVFVHARALFHGGWGGLRWLLAWGEI